MNSPSAAKGVMTSADPQMPMFEQGSLNEVARGVYLLRMPLPFRLDHINLYILDDSEGWTVIDCGLNTVESMTVWESLLASFLSDKPVIKIIVTHLHPDHIGLARWLQDKTKAPIYMTPPEWEMAQEVFSMPASDPTRLHAHYQRLGLQEERLQATIKQAASYQKMVKTLPQDVEFLQERDELSIAGRRWRIMLGKGHSPACACLWDEAEQILIGGDHILPNISPNINLLATGPSNPLQDYLVSLDAFRSLPCKTLLPAHGLPTSRYGERIDELLAHHAQHLECLQTACAAARTAAECVPFIFNGQLPDHQFYFAIGESAAHLVYLAEQGRLTRSGDASWRFVRP